MLVHQERVLGDRKLAKVGGQLQDLLAACWEETTAAGPDDAGAKIIAWGKVLQRAHFSALLNIRSLTYGLLVSSFRKSSAIYQDLGAVSSSHGAGVVLVDAADRLHQPVHPETLEHAGNLAPGCAEQVPSQHPVAQTRAGVFAGDERIDTRERLARTRSSGPGTSGQHPMPSG